MQTFPKRQKTVHSSPSLPSSVALFIVLNVLTLSSSEGLSSACCVCTMSPLPLHTQHPFQLFSLYTCLDHSSLKPLPLEWLCSAVTNSPFSSPLPTDLKRTSSFCWIISSLWLLHLLDEYNVLSLPCSEVTWKPPMTGYSALFVTLITACWLSCHFLCSGFQRANPHRCCQICVFWSSRSSLTAHYGVASVFPKGSSDSKLLATDMMPLFSSGVLAWVVLAEANGKMHKINFNGSGDLLSWKPIMIGISWH